MLFARKGFWVTKYGKDFVTDLRICWCVNYEIKEDW